MAEAPENRKMEITFGDLLGRRRDREMAAGIGVGAVGHG